MRIAFYHELHKGGARRGTNEFAKQLIKLGHFVDLYLIDNAQSDEKKIYSKIYFYKFNPKNWRGHNWRVRLYKDTIELFNLWKLNKRIAKDIKNRKYDIAYIAASQYIESPFILQFLKIPSFFYCNDPYYRIIYEPEIYKPKTNNIIKLGYEKLNRLLRKYLDRFNIGRANFIISISKFTRKKFISAYQIKGDVIYYGVDTSFFNPTKKDKDIDLLYIGSKDFLDGYPLLEGILKKINNKIKTRIITFENEWLSDKELLDTYRRSKILIAPSYNEPFGLVPLEAMSCGVVVLAVNQGGHRETVKNKSTGFLLKRDVNDFVAKINYLLRNKNIISRMSLNARNDMVKNWDWNVMGKKLEKLIYKKLNEIQEKSN